MSSQDCKPLLVFKQDAMTGGYVLTYGRVKVDKEIFFDCLTSEFYTPEYVDEKLRHILQVYEFTGQRKVVETEYLQNKQKQIDGFQTQIDFLSSKMEVWKQSYKLEKDPVKKQQIKTSFEQYKSDKQGLQEKISELNSKDTNEEVENLILYNGHSLFSTLLPNDFEYKCENGLSPDGKPVYVTRGVLMSGTLSKAAIGNVSGSLAHHLGKDYGYKRACDFVSYFQILINDWFLHHGYTVGLQDCIPNNTNLIQTEMNKCFLESCAIMRTEKDDELMEAKINGILGKATTLGQKIAKDALDPKNNLVSIIKSGAKGNDFNLTQVTSAVGQQNVSGSRITKIYGGRTLPHYKKLSKLVHDVDRLPHELLDDDNTDLLPILRNLFESRGFVANSFYKGLNPSEFFFHAAGGREGLIDTACKSVTWETLVIVMYKNKTQMIPIGKWIDDILEECPDKIQKYKEKDMELLELEDKHAYIPTVDEDGNVFWSEVTAVTRHDPTEIMYEVETLSGRKVTVTDSKSLLIWNPNTNKLIQEQMKNVKIGDFVPVNTTINKIPDSCEYVDMTLYFPKTEYIYGTEFHKAVSLMNEEMNRPVRDKETRTKLYKNWWKNVNGKVFTLPYPSKARLQRATVRSNISNIKEGCIYPYDANRKNTMIPDKFELNMSNGIFIGLFLADGYVDNTTIKITKKEKGVQQFIKDWFDKHNIHHDIDVKINKKTENVPEGSSETIRGNSSIFSSFLKQIVGNSSYDKKIPDFSYNAPEAFIIGLLNGYFSGDGYISKNSIGCSSVSEKLIIGINHLLSRLGIFCKLSNVICEQNNLNTENIAPVYTIDIRSNWATIFKEKIKLVNIDKDIKLNSIAPSIKHRNFDTQKDIVLDKIIRITPLDGTKISKVYDLTIPETLNFSLANGLEVVDTATTGYTQRKMMKMIEDLKVDYRNVVSRGDNNIIEFHYGEDNMDASRLIRTSKGLSFIDINHQVEKLNKDIEFELFKK